MDPISIYFFAIASILGLESTSIVSQKTSISINPVEKTFEVFQEDLFSIILTSEDSLVVVKEFQQIVERHKNSIQNTAEDWVVDDIVFNNTVEQLNATIKGRFTSLRVLADAGIHLDSAANSKFSIMNFPDWNLNISDAVLKEGYWSWPTDKTVTMSIEPYNNIPEEYLEYRQSVLLYWKQWMDGLPEK